MNLGQAIKKARDGKYSQKEIARLTGVTNVYISYLEKNKRDCSLSWLNKFSDIVGIPVPVIFYMAFEVSDQDGRRAFQELKPVIDRLMKLSFGINVGEEH